MFAICTDNEAKLVKMRELALKEYPAVLTFGCSAHYMSILEKDIGNTVILKQKVVIQKHFRNVYLSHGLLKEKVGCMPQLSNETCCNSQVAYLEPYKRNYKIYSEIWGENMKKIPANIGLLIDTLDYTENSRSNIDV